MPSRQWHELTTHQLSERTVPELQDCQLKGALQHLLGHLLREFQGRVLWVEVMACMRQDILEHRKVQQMRADTLRYSWQCNQRMHCREPMQLA
jgi:hypothetical protein